MYYCVDKTTGKRTSLNTTNEDEARQIVEAKNNSERQPVLNLQIAKAYLAGSDNGINTRTWQHAIEALTNTKKDANKERWLRVVKDRALIPLLPQVIIETKGESLLKSLPVGTVSTNVYLRRLYNFCVDMNWLPWRLIPKRQWPAVRFKDKRAITWEEHCKIVGRELARHVAQRPQSCPVRKHDHDLSETVFKPLPRTIHSRVRPSAADAACLQIVQRNTRPRIHHRPGYSAKSRCPH